MFISWIEWFTVGGLLWHARNVIAAGLLLLVSAGVIAHRSLTDGVRWTVYHVSDKTHAGAVYVAQKYLEYAHKEKDS